ncbi:response regulator [Mycobacteroides abscessus subsp. bolletii 1513]|uniref:Response regulator n=1 Tax=Mycobacteroides abscessus subsp. bolletii 1513 TaxID=1299321 RepID=X8DS25_9MYCO|nr:response regulator [Mycobacteroides abscessus subsp. bolletii 1513]
MADIEVGVLLVDDQELVRTGLRRILRRKDGFAIVGECADGSEVAAAVSRARPDVVIMDLRMKQMSGIEAIRLLHAAQGLLRWRSPHLTTTSCSRVRCVPVPPDSF